MARPVNANTHLIPALLLTYRPRKDERLSWPSWLTCSGWLTHISGHPSAAGRAQDRESSPARDRRSTTEPRHQLYQPLYKSLFTKKTVATQKHIKKLVVQIKQRSDICLCLLIFQYRVSGSSTVSEPPHGYGNSRAIRDHSVTCHPAEVTFPPL